MRPVLVGLLAALSLAAASDPAERLADPALEARSRALFKDVRCVVCQNESIDASDADLAADLRALVRTQVAAGRSDAEVRAFLVERYGEFVLLRPALSVANAALWAAPFAIVLAGLGVIALRARRRPAVDSDSDAAEAALSPEEAARLAALLSPAEPRPPS